MKRVAIKLGVVLLIVIICAFSYNRLVRLSQAADAQWAQVQTVYQRPAGI